MIFIRSPGGDLKENIDFERRRPGSKGDIFLLFISWRFEENIALCILLGLCVSSY